MQESPDGANSATDCGHRRRLVGDNSDPSTDVALYFLTHTNYPHTPMTQVRRGYFTSVK